MRLAKYQELVEQLKRQIKSGIWHPGDKLPSLRRQSEHSGLSLMTVLHAYQILESQGWVTSQPRSGYRVAPNIKSSNEPQAPAAVSWTEQVDINEFIFDVLQASKNPSMGDCRFMVVQNFNQNRYVKNVFIGERSKRHSFG